MKISLCDYFEISSFSLPQYPVKVFTKFTLKYIMFHLCDDSNST